MHGIRAINRTKRPDFRGILRNVIVPFMRRERFSRNAGLSTIDYCTMRIARKRHPGARRIHIRHSNVEADVAVYL